MSETATEYQIVKEGHFTDLREQIAEFKKKNESIVFDYETKKGDKEARSYIYKMRQAKSAIKTRHKEKKADILKASQELDAAKRELTGEIDEMIEVHDKPLRDIAARREKEEAERIAREQFGKDWEQAVIDNELFDRERELARREAELKRQEEERQAKEEADRLERERIENEERLKKEAAEQARLEAEQKAKEEKEAALRKQLEAEQAAKKAEEDKKAAELRAKLEAEEAEKKHLADIKAAEEKAEREKKEALEKQRREQEEKERLERERIAKKRAAEEARKADLEYRAEINRGILSKFVELGLTEDLAKVVIKAIVKNEIKNVSINY